MDSTRYSQLAGNFLRGYGGFDDSEEFSNKNYKGMQAFDTTMDSGDKILFSHVPDNYPATLIVSGEASTCYVYTRHSEESLSHPLTLDSKLSTFAAKDGVVFGISQDEKKNSSFYFIKNKLLLEQYIDKIELRMSHFGTREKGLTITTRIFLALTTHFFSLMEKLSVKKSTTGFIKFGEYLSKET